MKTKQKKATDRTVPKSKRKNLAVGWKQCVWDIETKSISLTQTNEHVRPCLGIHVFL